MSVRRFTRGVSRPFTVPVWNRKWFVFKELMSRISQFPTPTTQQPNLAGEKKNNSLADQY